MAYFLAFDWENTLQMQQLGLLKGFFYRIFLGWLDSQWLSEEVIRFFWCNTMDEAREWDELMFQRPVFI